MDLWRRQQSIERTVRKRPDLLKNADLTGKEWEYVRKLKKELKEEETQHENI